MKKNDVKDKFDIKKLFKVNLSVVITFWMTIILILGTALIAGIIYVRIQGIAGDYENDIGKLKNSLMVTLVGNLMMDEEHKEYSHTKKIISVFKDNFLNYVYIEKLNDEKEPELFLGSIPEKDSLVKTKDLTKSIENGNIIIHFGVPDNEKERNEKVIDTFRNDIKGSWLVAIVVGIFASLLISRIVSEPLGKLSNAAKEIAGGNFNVKLKESKISEINDMITSYNEMGGQLNELYTSLEQKVQERTLALEETNEKLKETQAMMVHSEKMRSLGELVAGIAHEINNPVNFIHGNIMILQNYADDLIGLIDTYSEGDSDLKPEIQEKVAKIKKQIDLEFLRDDIKDLIKSCIEGTQRTKNIVLDLKNFSRMEEMVLTQFDIPKEIDTTLNILNNKYKNRITVVKNYAPDAPKIEAYGGQLNQVFMNILDNAQDAIEDTGTLTINVDRVDENVKIEFIDTGKGIPEENLKKVFDPFFTTKAVGKGTGLGMSISYRVIKDHNGTIEVESKVGVGTKFTIVLPINHPNAEKTEEKTV